MQQLIIYTSKQSFKECYQLENYFSTALDGKFR